MMMDDISTKRDPLTILTNSITCRQDGYRALGYAIIIQAAKDKAWWFFKDSFIDLILPSTITKEKLLNQIMNNYEFGGSWKYKERKPKWWKKENKNADSN